MVANRPKRAPPDTGPSAGKNTLRLLLSRPAPGVQASSAAMARSRRAGVGAGCERVRGLQIALFSTADPLGFDLSTG